MSTKYLLGGAHETLENAVDEPAAAGPTTRVIVPQKVTGDRKFRAVLDHVTFSAVNSGRVLIQVRKVGGAVVRSLLVAYTDDLALDFRAWEVGNDEEIILVNSVAGDLGWSVVYHYE